MSEATVAPDTMVLKAFRRSLKDHDLKLREAAFLLHMDRLHQLIPAEINSHLSLSDEEWIKKKGSKFMEDTDTTIDNLCTNVEVTRNDLTKKRDKLIDHLWIQSKAFVEQLIKLDDAQLAYATLKEKEENEVLQKSESIGDKAVKKLLQEKEEVKARLSSLSSLIQDIDAQQIGPLRQQIQQLRLENQRLEEHLNTTLKKAHTDLESSTMLDDFTLDTLQSILRAEASHPANELQPTDVGDGEELAFDDAEKFFFGVPIQQIYAQLDAFSSEDFSALQIVYSQQSREHRLVQRIVTNIEEESLQETVHIQDSNDSEEDSRVTKKRAPHMLSAIKATRLQG